MVENTGILIFIILAAIWFQLSAASSAARGKLAKAYKMNSTSDWLANAALSSFAVYASLGILHIIRGWAGS